MKTLILANPNAGSLEGRDELQSAVSSMEGTTVVFTESPGDVEGRARESLEEDWDCVVAAGGDGTIHEAVNGLSRDFRKSRFGVLPLGTGNDLARSLGVPADLEQALDVLRRGEVRALDVIRVRFEGGLERVCLNAATGGFADELNEALDEGTKKAWGPLSYLRSAVEVVPDLKSFRLELEPEGQETTSLRAYSVAIANGRCVASGVQVAPEAYLDDGLLDVLVIPEIHVGQMAMLAPQVLAGRHLTSELIRFLRAGKVTVTADPPFPFNLDGEVHGTTPATFEVIPQALKVVVGSGAACGDAEA